MMPSRRTLCLLLLLGCAARAASAQGGRRRDTEPASAPAAAASAPASARSRLDLNTASAADLARLPRMTKGLARKVVDNRPYDEVRELVNRNIVPGNVYDAIKSRVEVNAP